MREFAHPNMSGGFVCPVCNTGKDAPVVLVGIPGTESDGTIECKQVHSECYELVCKMNNESVQIERHNSL